MSLKAVCVCVARHFRIVDSCKAPRTVNWFDLMLGLNTTYSTYNTPFHTDRSPGPLNSVSPHI